MKKLVSLILAITLLFSTVPVYAADAHWEQDQIGWRYVDESGNYVVSSWVTSKTGEGVDRYFYLNADGYMVTGWYYIDDAYYYFAEDGARYSGWLKDSGKWYYLGQDGKMVTGWALVGEHWYYMAEDGEMLTGWQKVNGVWRYFNSNGEWVDDNAAIQNTITGIDVSYWQGTIDWDAIKNEGVQFTFIRVGHGDRKLDTKFVRNITEANRVGIPAGVYFYSTAQSVEEAILDAQFVIDSVQGYTISYPIVIDMEDSSQENLGKQAITDMVIAFCNEIRAAGYTPMIYCNENWYKNYIDFSQLDGIERWIARYSVKGSASIERDIWQAGSTTRLNGIKGNVDINFAYTNYSNIIIPRTSYSSNYQKTTGIWKQDSVGMWFSHLDGTYTTNGWEEIQGNWYYFNASGYVVTNQWMYINNSWYYVDTDGARAEGWSCINGKWYYFSEDGIMQTGWLYVNENWYYLGDSSDGVMKTGWQYLNNKWYYFGDVNDGVMKYDWQYINDKWYYFGDKHDGAMKYDWQYINNKWYYFGGEQDGVMRFGWQWINNKWYYFGDAHDGVMKTGWQYINGQWYYFGEEHDGAMKYDWQYINNKWYYLSDNVHDGTMKTGWQYIRGQWYYMDQTGSGAMLTGWQYINGQWYYMYESGQMAASTWIGNYYVDSKGVWTQTR